MLGPVSSGYAGKTPTLCFAGFMTLIFVGVLISAYKRRHDPHKRLAMNSLIFIAIVFAFVIGMAIWNVWKYN
jgi:predicted tellurium resistance membrane protein TerC